MTGPSDPNVISLPVGFMRFHRRRFIDYQLNRAHALGFADATDLHWAAARIRRPADAVKVFEDLAARADAAGQLDDDVAGSLAADTAEHEAGAERQGRVAAVVRDVEPGEDERGRTAQPDDAFGAHPAVVAELLRSGGADGVGAVCGRVHRGVPLGRGRSAAVSRGLYPANRVLARGTTGDAAPVRGVGGPQ